VETFKIETIYASEITALWNVKPQTHTSVEINFGRKKNDN
jgi:hypothetical protein